MFSTHDYIRDEFQLLGIRKSYDGYERAIRAIELALEDESCLRQVMERIYKVVDEQYDKGSAEHNIRYILHVAWKKNPQRLQELAGYGLDAAPTVSEFLSMMVAHIQREMAKQSRAEAESQ